MVIDDKQRKIIRELQQDSKKSLRDIGATLDLPLSTVHSRIQKMEKDELIIGQKTLFDAKKLGLPTTAFIFVRLGFKDTDGRRAPDYMNVVKQISAMPHIQEVHLMAGEWDIFIKLRAESTQAVGRLVMDDLRSIVGVDRCLTNMVFETVKETTDLPI